MSSALDIENLESKFYENAMCPGSCVVATSLINDTSFDQWMVAWLQQRTCTKTKSQMKKSLVYGISSSGKSKDVIKALQWASDNGLKTALVTSNPIEDEIKGLAQVVLGAEYYHTAEVLTLLLQYQLTHGSGKSTSVQRDITTAQSMMIQLRVPRKHCKNYLEIIQSLFIPVKQNQIED